jgi:hypothetical protein
MGNMVPFTYLKLMDAGGCEESHLATLTHILPVVAVRREADVKCTIEELVGCNHCRP